MQLNEVAGGSHPPAPHPRPPLSTTKLPSSSDSLLLFYCVEKKKILEEDLVWCREYFRNIGQNLTLTMSDEREEDECASLKCIAGARGEHQQ